MRVLVIISDKLHKTLDVDLKGCKDLIVGFVFLKVEITVAKAKTHFPDVENVAVRILGVRAHTASEERAAKAAMRPCHKLREIFRLGIADFFEQRL